MNSMHKKIAQYTVASMTLVITLALDASNFSIQGDQTLPEYTSDPSLTCNVKNLNNHCYSDTSHQHLVTFIRG